MTLTKDQKQELLVMLQKLNLVPARSGEVCISISPQGTIGNIKVISNTG